MTGEMTDAAEAAVALSQEAASQLGSPYTGAEHLILGLLKLDAGSIPPGLSALGLPYGSARAAVARFSGIEQEPEGSPPPLSPTCLSTLERACSFARRRGSDVADVEDVLGALLDPETFGVASDRFLWELGQDAGAVEALRQSSS